jgi:hypothetical protein
MKKNLMVTAVFVAWICAAVSGTALGDLAASMQPGQWRELSTTGLTQSFLETSGDYPSHHNIVSYAAKAQWDPNSKQFLFLGSRHEQMAHGAPARKLLQLGPLPRRLIGPFILLQRARSGHGKVLFLFAAQADF